jgi:dihydropteroate synthase
MTAMHRTPQPWRLRTCALELGRRTLIMGIVNLTPDSFSDGGLFARPELALARATQLLNEGADLLDLGAESTRPGARAGAAAGSAQPPAVSADEEQARLLPALEAILKELPHAVLSIDTYKAPTARAALAAGAQIVNDVSGLQWDPAMAYVCAQAQCGLVLMHTRGRPDEWRNLPQLASNDLLAAVRTGLKSSLETAQAAGIYPESIVLDPGYGFGKQNEENYALLARQAELLALGRPLLIGLSRKSFLGQTLAPLHAGLSAPVAAREAATLAAQVAAILHGASILRVHSVRPAVEAARIADAILAAGA